MARSAPTRSNAGGGPDPCCSAHRCGVQAAGGDQLVVATGLDDSAPVEHQDAVIAGDRRQPVGDGDGGAVPADPLEGLDEPPFGLRVERGSRLVEQQNVGVADQRPGDGHPLPLSAREVGAAGTHRRAHPAGQGASTSASSAASAAAAIAAWSASWLPEGDVLRHRPVEQEAVLEDHAQPRPDRCELDSWRISFPSKRIDPSSGSWSRINSRSRVDLPEPDGPTIATRSPRLTVRSTLSSTRGPVP